MAAYLNRQLKIDLVSMAEEAGLPKFVAPSLEAPY